MDLCITLLRPFEWGRDLATACRSQRRSIRAWEASSLQVSRSSTAEASAPS